MNKLEYKTLVYEPSGVWGGRVDETLFDEKLNELASDGWEIDHCFPVAMSNGQTKSVVFIFKREIKKI